MKPKASWKMAAGILVLALLGLVAINVGNGQADDGSSQSAAQTETTSQQTLKAGEQALGSSVLPALIKMGLALLAVVVCIYLGLYVLRRMMGKKYSGNRAGQVLEVLETTYLAPKKSVTLVRVANKAIVVGMTESSMVTLSELDDEQTREILDAQNVTVPDPKFEQVLSDAFGKLTALASRRKKPALESLAAGK